MKLNEQDKAKIKRLKQFEAKLNKLLASYPDVKLYGDMNGGVRARTVIGSGFSTRSESTNTFGY